MPEVITPIRSHDEQLVMSIIDQIIERAANFEKDNIHGPRFNPFDALTRFHLEELHSNFLAYLLDPCGRHGCGSLFLSLFLKALPANPLLDPLVKSNEFLLRTRVIREQHIGYAADSEVSGRMDIIIQTPVLNLVIENKIYAGEMCAQIKRYVRYCKQQHLNFIVYFLTPVGRDSSEAGDELYTSISYQKHVVQWLKECMAVTAHLPGVYIGVSYYLDLLESKIIKSHNNLAMNIKELLLEPANRRLIPYGMEIRDAVTAIRNEKRVEFFERVLLDLNAAEKRFDPVMWVFDEIDIASIWDKVNRGFTLLEERFVLNLDGVSVWCALEHDWQSLYFGLFLYETSPEGIKNNSAALADIHNMMNEATGYSLDLYRKGVWHARCDFSARGYAFDHDSYTLILLDDMNTEVKRCVEGFNSYVRAWEHCRKRLYQSLSSGNSLS